jgi:hypothetical protein
VPLHAHYRSASCCLLCVCAHVCVVARVLNNKLSGAWFVQGLQDSGTMLLFCLITHDQCGLCLVNTSSVLLAAWLLAQDRAEYAAFPGAQALVSI